MFSKRIITELDDFISLKEDWDALAEIDTKATLFNSFAWIENWIKHYWAIDYKLNVIVIEVCQKPLAILPLYLDSKKKTILFLGTGEPEISEVCSEYLDFIVDRELAESDKTYSYIASCLREFSAPSIEFTNCFRDSHVFAVAALVDCVSCVETGNQYTLQLESISHSDDIGTSTRQKKNTRQLMSRYNRNKKLSANILIESNYQKHWEILKNLHQQDWQSRGKSGALLVEVFSEFHNAMHDEHPEILQFFSSLSHGDEVISIHHYYKYKDVLYFYLTGTVKTDFKRLSPGMMLHVLSLSKLSGEKIFYDFMKGSGNGSYKEKLCERGDSFYTITIHSRNVLGQLRLFKDRLRKLKNIMKRFYS